MMWVAIAVLVLVVGFLLAVVSRPASFRVERTATMAAPADIIFGNVNDFQKWQAWSPWEGLDPNLKRTYSGAPAGVGATYAWSGNNKAGEGVMTITDSTPAQRVGIDLRFTRPFKAKNITEFTFKPASSGTEVTWTMSGQNDFMGKAFSMFVDMDKMVGKDFEKGLAALDNASRSQTVRS